jgi:DNA repair exonuclease SbcCD nuclease subunit
MQKIIHITDPHISGKNPICRTDNLVKVQFEKLKEIVIISNKLEAPIICTGDLTDSPNIAYSTYTKLANVLKRCRKGFYTLYGNHDLQFHTMDSSNSVALGALIESVPNVKHIEKFYDDYGIAIDYEDWNDIHNIIELDEESKILICHRAIVNPKMVSRMWMKENTIDFYMIEEVKKYPLILCGHFHKQYEINNTQNIVLNPGCFTRRNANDVETHKPSYYVIELDHGSFRHELFSLPNSKRTEDVISDSHLTYTRMAKNIKEEISEYYKKIKFSKNENQFKSNLIKTFNDLEEGSFKDTVRELLQKIYGDKIEGVNLNGLSRFSKTKRHTLEKRSEE